MKAQVNFTTLTTPELEKFKQATRCFWRKQVWVNPYALTLTLKLYDGLKRLDQISASENVHHFLNRLNRRVGCRRQAHLKTFSVFECTQRPHFHLCIDCPPNVDEARLREQVYQSWIATRWARREIAVEPCYAVEGWLSYMAKSQTKAAYIDAIDWRNCY